MAATPLLLLLLLLLVASSRTTLVYLLMLTVLAISSIMNHAWISTRVFQERSGTLQAGQQRTPQQRQQSSLPLPLVQLNAIAQPFGRRSYWENVYQEQGNVSFSWYASWNDLEPLVAEWVAPSDRVLIPGVGVDSSLLCQMYDAGYQQLAAFDYVAESIVHCRTQLGPDRVAVHLSTADARDLHQYETASFDAVLDKGALDAVFLAGETVEARHASLAQALAELARVLRPGGVFWSLSGVCVDSLRAAPLWTNTKDGDGADAQSWQVLADGSSVYTTADGYTSNNVDGTLLAWRKLEY